MNGSNPRFLVIAALSALGAACSQLPYEHDDLAIVAHYPHKHQGPCSSWIRSFKTGYEYCASPAVEVTVSATSMAAPAPAAAASSGGAAPAEDGPVELAALRERGEKVYGSVCSACHGAQGAGVPGAFPPLAGSGEYYGEPQNMAKIIVHGLNGEIVVQGQTYNGIMPPQGAALSDYEIASVATFVRTSWGNDDGMVTPDDVKAVR